MITQDVIEKAFDERFPLEVKEKLHHAKVAIAGLGGLGSNIALMLARSGVGQLFLVDFERVEITNLNRQTDVMDGCGLMAPRVAICAGHQANKVIQLILE